MCRKLVLSVVLFSNILCFGMDDEGNELSKNFAQVQQELDRLQRVINQLPASDNAERLKKTFNQVQELSLEIKALPREQALISTIMEIRFCTKVYPPLKKVIDSVSKGS